MNRPLSSLPMYVLCLFIFFSFVISVIFICILFFSIRYKSLRKTIFSSVFVLINSFLTVCLLEITYEMEKKEELLPFIKMVYDLPHVYVFIYLFLNFIILAVFIDHAYINDRDRISTRSIYEGINNLDGGICFFRENGTPVMVNKEMDRISFILSGRALNDGYIFMEKVEEKAIRKSDKTYIIKADERIIMILLSILEDGSQKYFQVNSFDISERYELSKELERNNESLFQMQERLKNYNKDLEKITIEEELLKTKSKVHSEYGKILLSGKYSLETDKKEDKESFLKEWKKLNRLFEEEEDYSSSDDLKELEEVASSIGISVHINGTIEEGHMKMVIALLHECLTNTCKHTTGNNLFLDIACDEDIVTYTSYNDGEHPKENFSEGGGLSSLRKRIENNYGIIEYDISREFKVILKLKKGEKYDY